MPIPFTIDVVYRDESGSRATAGYHVGSELTQPQYVEGGQALAPLLDDFTDGVIESMSLTVPVDISGLTDNTAEVGSDVEEAAEFGMITTENRGVSVVIPGLLSDYFTPGSDDLDQSDPLLAPLISMFENGLATTGGTIQPCDVGEIDVSSVIRARKITRPSGTRRR